MKFALGRTIALSSMCLLFACSGRHGDTTVGQTGLPWATGANFSGGADPNQVLRVQVHLAMQDEAGARAMLDAISDPDNALYGQFLSDDDFAAKYAPTMADVTAVRAHLEKNGFRVTEVPKNLAYVAAEGTVGQAEKAFSTTIGNFQVRGETRFAPTQQPVLPADVATHVSAVLGLNSPTHVHLPSIVDRLANTAKTTSASVGAPCSGSYYGQSVNSTDPPYGSFQYPFPNWQCSGYLPKQMRVAYGFDDAVNNGNDGTGQTIAITDGFLNPTLLADAQTYAQNNDPAYPLSASQLTAQLGPGTLQPTDTSWYVEQALDVETIHAIAPNANIFYLGFVSDNLSDAIAALNFIVANHSATVVSNSWGPTEAEAQGEYTAAEYMAIQAGLKGIGLYFASGDNGDNAPFNNGVPTPSFPCSLPEVTCVGGTALALNADGGRLFELGWENSAPSFTTDDAGTPEWTPAPPAPYLVGSGGGTSSVYLQPKYQVGIVPDALANVTGAPSRVTPDVAMDGDAFMNGIRVGSTLADTSWRGQGGTYSEYFEGGTSLATPLFSATVILAQQHNHRILGFANPLFYKSSKHGAFIDIAPDPTTQRAVDLNGAPVLSGLLWTLDFQGPGNTLATAPGYDNVTGLGVPNGTQFFDAIKR
jgi:subtilase family serine protease